MERGSEFAVEDAAEVSQSGRGISLSPPMQLPLCLFKHNATETNGAVEVQFQEFLSWAVDPDGQLYNPVALCIEE